MSSVYSSRRTSLSEPEPLPEHSKSVPETPAKALQRPVFRTVPDSPQHNRLLSDDHGLDLQILTHKLQLYQLELEEAELRFKHNRVVPDKEAIDVAAAARFRDGLNKLDKLDEDISMENGKARSRSTSLQKSETTSPRKNLPTNTSTKSLRTKRPEPLMLADAPVEPQEVQSAALPTRTNRGSNMNASEMKKHWRRTTISAGPSSASKIILLSSTGQAEYCDFDVPPVPQLSASVSTATSPPSMSPMTPLHTEPSEDQIRRELETFALEEGPNLHLSRRSSAVSRRRMFGTFVPDPDDILPNSKNTIPLPLPPPPPPPPAPPEVHSAFVDVPESGRPQSAHHPGLTRKKSFFSRFERKNDVDDLLDLYMTDEQINEVKIEKKKATRSRRQTFFKRWQSTDALLHKADKPG